MISKKVTIKNPTGLHLRPAGLFCKMALEYESKITFHYRDTEGNAKSVLSVLGACGFHKTSADTSAEVFGFFAE